MDEIMGALQQLQQMAPGGAAAAAGGGGQQYTEAEWAEWRAQQRGGARAMNALAVALMRAERLHSYCTCSH